MNVIVPRHQCLFRFVCLLGIIILYDISLLCAADPLSSWNETSAKQAIVSFVKKVTTTGSADFVPASERIATFDNADTLWSGQPMIELLESLRTYEFKIFIVSRGGIEFMRPWSEREWAYDDDSQFRRLDKAWDEAPWRGWIIVNMKPTGGRFTRTKICRPQ